jgi:hypothetical protein
VKRTWAIRTPAARLASTARRVVFVFVVDAELRCELLFVVELLACVLVVPVWVEEVLEDCPESPPPPSPPLEGAGAAAVVWQELFAS